ncbi:MAG: KamA family protein [Bacteroidales bacterium]|nr:KamA family protein [Bacteroidales bacterium]
MDYYLDMSSEQWALLFKNELIEITSLAKNTTDALSFEKKLSSLIGGKIKNEKLSLSQKNAAKTILQMLHFEKKPYLEGSEDEVIKIDTFKKLWNGLNNSDKNIHPDFYYEIYKLFNELYYENKPINIFDNNDKDINSSVNGQKNLSFFVDRWKSGLDEDVIAIRNKNKKRIISLLVEDISTITKNRDSRYKFNDGISNAEKIDLVNEWWYDYRFHLAQAVKTPQRLNKYLNYTLSEEQINVLNKAKEKGIPFFITPYYIALLDVEDNNFDDSTIRSYVLYTESLVKAFGSIKAWEREDAASGGKVNVAGWVLPDGNCVHRRYPDVAIIIPDTMGRACGGLCASCQRMYGFQKGDLNFNLDELKPKIGWLEKFTNTLSYFENDSQLRDILITGGDALMSQNKTLRIILDEVCKMAMRKKSTNEFRKEGEKFAEIQRIRLGTRLPVYMPFRINDELVEILSEIRVKGVKAGIKQFVIQTHFQSPLELTLSSLQAIRKIQSAGWIITNQLVYTVAASRRGHNVKLREVLNNNGILTYYTFTVKGFDENWALYTPNARSVQEQIEEKKYGKIQKSMLPKLQDLVEDPFTLTNNLRKILSDRNMHFIASDRSVMNLPGIGKSMTFKVAGLDEYGRRILAFSYDKTRKHSPLITGTKQILIRERKSLAEYLRQLKKMGENIGWYDSIWSFRKAKTESRFPIYEYPDFDFEITKKYTNLY